MSQLTVKSLFEGRKGFRHDDQPRLGVLVTNLGTPDAPTTPALRRYLHEFLWDPGWWRRPVGSGG